ncbi:MAG: V-type ATPase subunit [Oscillibacter sp.]|nr:V-type ATPase subunit [Oscillibacter sp.]
MSKKIKDTDYLAISARIKAMETGLLTGERMEQMLAARSDEEIMRVLQECGYPDFSLDRPEEMDAALSKAREETLLDLGGSAPDAGYLDVFQLKYDYHNVKALLKAKAVGADAASMLMDLGRVPVSELQEALDSGEDASLPTMLAQAAAEAKEVLETTRDPQLSDFVLDRWYYKDLMAAARKTGSSFLTGYVRASIDAANLRSLVRTLRMGRDADFLKGVLFEGGDIAADSVAQVAASVGSGLAELYASTDLKAAAESGAKALDGGSLTEFEKLCDDAVSAYLAGAQLVPFGEAPLVGYLAARETEYTNLRIILLGRKAGLSADVIRSRLRESYV